MHLGVSASGCSPFWLFILCSSGHPLWASISTQELCLLSPYPRWRALTWVAPLCRDYRGLELVTFLDTSYDSSFLLPNFLAICMCLFSKHHPVPRFLCLLFHGQAALPFKLCFMFTLHPAAHPHGLSPLRKKYIVYSIVISCLLCLRVCMCTTSVPGARRRQKRVLDPWGLKLWVVLDHHACAGNVTQVLWKNNKHAHPPEPPSQPGRLSRERLYSLISHTEAFLSCCLRVYLSSWEALASLHPLLPSHCIPGCALLDPKAVAHLPE